MLNKKEKKMSIKIRDDWRQRNEYEKVLIVEDVIRLMRRNKQTKKQLYAYMKDEMFENEFFKCNYRITLPDLCMLSKFLKAELLIRLIQ